MWHKYTVFNPITLYSAYNFSGWCATSTTEAFDFIDGKWGYCEEKCLGMLWENRKNTKVLQLSQYWTQNEPSNINNN